jgi:uncharacterized membrane protein YesL
MLSRALKMAFWVTYDHLGKLILANLLGSLVLLVPVALVLTALATGDPSVALVVGGPLLLLLLGVFLPVMAAGLAAMMKEIIETRDGSLKTFFTGMRRFGVRAVGIGVIYVVAISCLLTSVWFYAARLGGVMPWLGYALSAAAVWCLIFVGFTSTLVIPALVQKGGGIWPTLKLSALLVLDNPLFCIGLALHVAILGTVCMLPPLFLFFSVAPLLALESTAYEMLARKYAILEARQTLDAAQRKAPIDFKDEEDDYLSRGFRDFLFPWKG